LADRRHASDQPGVTRIAKSNHHPHIPGLPINGYFLEFKVRSFCMSYIVTVSPSKSLITMPHQVCHSKAKAFLVACGFLRAGYEGVAISNGSGKRIEGPELEMACQSGQLTF
jgi:hypothetical protein